MRTETDMPPIELAGFKATSGYLEQGTRTSWERLVQAEMTLRGRTRHPLDTKVAVAGLILSAISAMTFVFGEIYRHLGGAIIAQVETTSPIQEYLIGAMILGLTLAIGGRIAFGSRNR